LVLEAPDVKLPHPARGSLGRGIQEPELQTERVAREGEHAAELAAAEDADPHAGSRGSGASRTARVCSSRNARRASRRSGWRGARIAAARSAALTAPALPMASVPTGIPLGIWTIESSESIPLSDRDS